MNTHRENKKPHLKVTCRPARPEDTETVLSLTSLIWEGDDYIPHVWEEWLHDPEGVLLVAEYQGEVVGLGKLTRLSDEDWWMEGLRVHPQREGRGIGTQLHYALLDAWQQSGGGFVRLATSSAREAVHRLCARSGLKKVAELTFYAFSCPPPGEKESLPFQQVRLEELGDAHTFIRNSPLLGYSHGLIDLYWRWAPPRIEYLQPMVEKGELYWWREGRGLLACLPDEDDEGNPALYMKIAACSMEDLPRLLKDYPLLGAEKGCTKAGWLAPNHADIQAKVRDAGYARDWENDLYLFEKPHPTNR